MFVELLLSPGVEVNLIHDENNQVTGLRLSPSFVSSRSTEKLCQLRSTTSGGHALDSATLLVSGANGLFKKQASSVKIRPKCDSIGTDAPETLMPTKR